MPRNATRWPPFAVFVSAIALAERRTRGTAIPRLTRQHQILPPEHWASLIQAIVFSGLEHYGSGPATTPPLLLPLCFVRPFGLIENT